MDERPEVLLKSALEKIVYFEARSEQLQNDVRAAHAEVERHRKQTAAFEEREIELRRTVTELEVKLQRATAALEEQTRLNEVARMERTELIGKLLETARIDQSSRTHENEDALDLASFISELRQHAQSLQSRMASTETAAPVWVGATAVAAPSLSASAHSGVTQQAARLRAEGRLEVSPQNLLELAASKMTGKAEETLFDASVRELAAPESTTRIRAAERLKNMGNAAAAPALAQAIHAEAESETLIAFLSAFASLASKDSVEVVMPLLHAESSEVRIAALKALLHMDAVTAGPHLAQAVKDADPHVRRRASLLALGLSGEEAFRLGEFALSDSDAEVRSVAALVLGASGKPQARVLLQSALRDTDKKVRQAAAQSLERVLGQHLAQVVEMDEAQRRREVRRIATLPERTVRASPPPLTPGETSLMQKKQRMVPVAPVAPVLNARAQDEKLCQALMTELRMALRGRSLNELASRASVSVDVAEQNVALLVARGQAVQRGAKYFAA